MHAQRFALHPVSLIQKKALIFTQSSVTFYPDVTNPHKLRGCLGTRLHAGMHADLVALSPVPCALCILPDTTISWSFGRFRRDIGSVNAACTPACTPARQKLHSHLRASYILPFCMHGSILRAYTWLNTRGTDVC